MSDLKKQETETLRHALQEKQVQLQDLRFRMSSGQLKTVRNVRHLRQQIAQLMTILEERTRS